ncbi:hypothetical protein IWX90DRAFT_498955 [Phyllosticta citrichinensis]|uniref:Uncharacterized protein n=1 Tax=Phyllosticta citrichinensis TaxID=1130410 RepID=A0ABR1XY49_9PEZI
MPDDRKPAAEKPNNHQDKPQRPEDENPFIAFRRYADEQVSSILNAFGLPLSWNPQHWNDERIQELKSWITERKTPSGKEDAASSSPQDPPSWIKIWAPDDREVKPKVIENDDGSKTYYWSKSWSWPPKESAKTDNANDLDATQRQAVEEARRNAEKEMQELSNKFKSFFGTEEEKAAQDRPKSGSVLDWVWPSQPKSNPDKGVDISKEASPEQESKSSREKVWGRHHGPCRSRDSEDQRVTAALHGHHGFPPFMHFYGPRFGPHRFGDCRVRWLLSHPYSPVVLEAEHTKFNVHGPNFVDAFEDLLRVDQGLPIDERWAWERDMWPRRMRLMSILHSPHPKTQEFWNNMHEGGDWYVAKRGLKPLQEQAKSLPMPEASKDETVAPQKSSSEGHDQAYERFLGFSSSEPETELDAYEQLLGGDSASSLVIKQPQQPKEHQSSVGKAGKPTTEVVEASPILSTVTSTERTVLPDGTVTTKVVFRKRFADGREESSETVNTTRGDAASAAPEAAAPAESTSSGGWFWSK